MRELLSLECALVAGGPPENPPADIGPEPNQGPTVVEAAVDVVVAAYKVFKSIFD